MSAGQPLPSIEAIEDLLDDFEEVTADILGAQRFDVLTFTLSALRETLSAPPPDGLGLTFGDGAKAGVTNDTRSTGRAGRALGLGSASETTPEAVEPPEPVLPLDVLLDELEDLLEAVTLPQR